MSDKMRETAEQAYTMTAHDYCANPVGSRDWTLFWRGWQAALAEQPAQGEAVGWLTDQGTFHFDKTDAWNDSEGFIEPLYTAPPAPAVSAVPDLREAVRKASQLASIACDWNLSEVEIDGEMVSTYALKDAFDAALAAAPEVKS